MLEVNFTWSRLRFCKSIIGLSACSSFTSAASWVIHLQRFLNSESDVRANHQVQLVRLQGLPESL